MSHVSHSRRGSLDTLIIARWSQVPGNHTESGRPAKLSLWGGWTGKTDLSVLLLTDWVLVKEAAL